MFGHCYLNTLNYAIQDSDDYHWDYDSFENLLNNHDPKYIIYFDDLLIDLVLNANKGIIECIVL